MDIKRSNEVIDIRDVSEASYYLMFGARIVSVRRHTVSDRKAGRLGYKDQWIIELKDIIPWLKESWKQGMAYGNITDFVNVRTKLKRKIKRELGITS